MLTILARNQGRFCDGVSRRNFLRIGAVGMGGLALPQLLEAEATAGIRKSHKAVINIFLASYRFKKPVMEVSRAVLPMQGVLIVGVLLITYFPPLTTWLPRWLGR